MATTILFVALMLGVLAFVAAPIYRAGRDTGSNHRAVTHRLADLLQRKETVYANIKELDFDYHMGKLSEEDYQRLRAQYKAEAVEILQQIDRLQGKKVAARTIHASQAAESSEAVKFCWMCGTPVLQQDKFCVNCGNRIR